MVHRADAINGFARLADVVVQIALALLDVILIAGLLFLMAGKQQAKLSLSSNSLLLQPRADPETRSWSIPSRRPSCRCCRTSKPPPRRGVSQASPSPSNGAARRIVYQSDHRPHRRNPLERELGALEFPFRLPSF